MSTGNRPSTQSGHKKKSAWWKWLIGIAVLAVIALLITLAIRNTEFSNGFGWKGWVTLFVLVLSIGLLSYAIYRLTRKKKSADPHHKQEGKGEHGAHGGDHGHGTPTMKFWEFFGKVILPLAVVAWVVWTLNNKRLEYEARKESEDQSKREAPYQTHTSRSGGDDSGNGQKKFSSQSVALNDEKIVYIFVNHAGSVTIRLTGGDYYRYVGDNISDTSDIDDKLLLASNDTLDFYGRAFYAFRGKKGIKSRVRYECTLDDTSKIQMYETKARIATDP